MKLDQQTKYKLFEAWNYCDEEDKSTEFMIVYMQDYAQVDFDTVMKFIEDTSFADRQRWFEETREHEVT